MTYVGIRRMHHDFSGFYKRWRWKTKIVCLVNYSGRYSTIEPLEARCPYMTNVCLPLHQCFCNTCKIRNRQPKDLWLDLRGELLISMNTATTLSPLDFVLFEQQTSFDWTIVVSWVFERIWVLPKIKTASWTLSGEMRDFSLVTFLLKANPLLFTTWKFIDRCWSSADILSRS